MAEAGDAPRGAERIRTPNFLPGTDPPVSWVTSPSGQVQVLHGAPQHLANAAVSRGFAWRAEVPATLAGGAEIWQAWGGYYLAGSAPYNGGSVVMARRLPVGIHGPVF